MNVGCLVREKNLHSNKIYIWFGEVIKNSYYDYDFYVFHYVDDLGFVAYMDENNFEII